MGEYKELGDYIAACHEREFKWGVFDCCLFTADCVQLAGGEDYAKPMRGKYGTKLGAAKILKKICGGGIDDYMLDLGFKEIDLEDARLPDVVTHTSDCGRVLSFCLGSFVIGPEETKGLFVLNKYKLKEARFWRWEQ